MNSPNAISISKVNIGAVVEWKTLLWYKNRKPHQWVLFQVNKIHKMSCPIYQMHSKCKSHIGCCQYRNGKN